MATKKSSNTTNKSVAEKPMKAETHKLTSSKTKISNHSFEEVKIGKQIWMAKNLNVKYFRNGDEIPEAKTDKEWKEAHKKKKPAFCYFKNDSTKDVLYNWWAIEDSRGLAPEGYIIPDETDFYELVQNLGGDEKALNSLKSKAGWEKEAAGNGKSKFEAKPTGSRDNDGIFAGDGISYFWSSSEGALVLTPTYLSFDPPYRYSLDDENGLAVRCVKPFIFK